MKCNNHTDVDATSMCTSCNKALCKTCAERFDSVLCEQCLLNHNRTLSRKMLLELAISLAIFAGSWALFANMTGTPHQGGFAWFQALFLTFTYWGWKFISDNQSFAFIGNINFWLMYFMIKFFISIFIGLFVGPYKIYKMTKELVTARKMAKQIENGEI